MKPAEGKSSNVVDVLNARPAIPSVCSCRTLPSLRTARTTSLTSRNTHGSQVDLCDLRVDSAPLRWVSRLRFDYWGPALFIGIFRMVIKPYFKFDPLVDYPFSLDIQNSFFCPMLNSNPSKVLHRRCPCRCCRSHRKPAAQIDPILRASLEINLGRLSPQLLRGRAETRVAALRKPPGTSTHNAVHPRSHRPTTGAESPPPSSTPTRCTRPRLSQAYFRLGYFHPLHPLPAPKRHLRCCVLQRWARSGATELQRMGQCVPGELRTENTKHTSKT